MDKILIPDCCQELTEGSIVIIGRFPETKWVLHCGWYVYEGIKYNGWYFVSIPAQTILPVIGSDLQNITIISMGECCNGSHHICPCPPSPNISIRSIEQYMAGVDYTKGQILWLKPGEIYQVTGDFKSSYTWESVEDNLKDDIESGFLAPIMSDSLSGNMIFALDFQNVFGTDTPTKTEADDFLSQFDPPIVPVSGIAFINTNQESESASSMYTYCADDSMTNLLFMKVASKGIKGDTGADGKSAYEIWKDQGNEGDENIFLDSLKGEIGETGATGETGKNGQNGKSAYQVWLDEGHYGDESAFFASLKGDMGDTGADGISPTVSTKAIDNGIKITITDNNADHEFTLLNGEKGDIGPQGINGNQVSLRVQNDEIQWNWIDSNGNEVGIWTALVSLSEITGPAGYNGTDGNDGTEITGIAFTSSNKGIEAGIAGATDTYTVSCSNGSSYTILVYNGKNGLDGGMIIDETMSDNSTNPVQNKVIKDYVDGLVGDISSVLAALVEVTE